MEKFKFGPQVGGAIVSRKAGLFGEYALTRGLGIKSGLFYESNCFGMQDVNDEKGNGALVRAKYISLPAILRTYPGRSRQFCVFFGLQGRYLIGGEAVYISTEDPDQIASILSDPSKTLSPVNLKDKTQHTTPVSIIDEVQTDFGRLVVAARPRL